MSQSRSSGPRSARRQVLSTHTPRRGAAFLAYSHGSSHPGKVREPLLPTSCLAALFLLTLEPHTHAFHVDRASICSHNCKTMNLRTCGPLPVQGHWSPRLGSCRPSRWTSMLPQWGMSGVRLLQLSGKLPTSPGVNLAPQKHGKESYPGVTQALNLEEASLNFSSSLNPSCSECSSINRA